MAYSMDRIEQIGETIDILTACNRVNRPLVRGYCGLATAVFVLFLLLLGANMTGIVHLECEPPGWNAGAYALFTVLMVVWGYNALHMILAYDTYITMLEGCQPRVASWVAVYSLISIWGFLGGLAVSWTCFTAYRWAAATPISLFFSTFMAVAAFLVEHKRR